MEFSGYIMNQSVSKAVLLALALAFSGAANADLGVGLKAGTLGLGIEGRWSPLPWLDFRMGANRYDFDVTGSQSGILVLDEPQFNAHTDERLNQFLVVVVPPR